MIPALLALWPMQFDTATTPASRISEDWLAKRHQFSVEATKAGGFDVALLGASIVQDWEGTGRQIWDRSFAPLKAANFGFSGDRTEHALWRIENGEIVGAKPKLIVVCDLASNNVGHGSSTPREAVEGLRAIVKRIARESPESKILILAPLPRGEKPDDRLRLAVKEAAELSAALADGRKIFFLDIGSRLIEKDGMISPQIMPDYLHLSSEGYQIWADAMLPEIKRRLKLETTFSPRTFQMWE